MKKSFFLIILLNLVILCLADSADAQLERTRAQEVRPVELTFMAPRNINLYTIEPLSPGELHYSIMHTFGTVDTGIRNLWGIDQGANVRFSFEFGLTERLSLGFGRSSLDKVVDLTGRYSLLKQMSDNSIPVSVSLNTSTGINTSSFGFLAEDYTFGDRLNFTGSLLIARKISDDFSLQVSPTIVHFNRVGQETNVADPDLNTYYAVGVATRYKIKPRTALSAQYIPTLNGENTSYNLAVGIDIETGGHVFQMFFTTSRALNDQYLIAGENGDFFDRQFRFGFNVNRLFNIRGR
jgi:hypothetical protein